ncbi:MAG: hypothetical protein AB9866_05625 [Syntrophobacteraceae bacterium]
MRITNLGDPSTSSPNDSFCISALMNAPKRGEQVWVGRDSSQQRWEIISAYLEILENMTEPVAMESELPCSKEDLRHIIFRELIDDPHQDSRHHLEIAYIQLENFISGEEYAVMSEFKNASLMAQEMAEMGDPASIIMSARVMKKDTGESAVQIQERISERMRQRRMQLRRIGCSVCSVNSD